MALVVGVVLALAVGLFAAVVGLDRDRAFYPVVTIVVAAYYVLFAVIGESTRALVLESSIGAAFVVAAAAGFRRSLWVVALALIGHGVFDLAHASLVANPGVPAWWPDFCCAYDVTAGITLAWALRTGRIRSAA